MAIKSSQLWLDPVFRAGLLLRIACVILLVPQIQQELFVPFIRNALAHPSFDPWSSFLAHGGDPTAYPYGPVMFLAHLPGALLGCLLDATLNCTCGAAIGIRLSLLLADCVVLRLLLQLFPKQPRQLLWLYWFSPIGLFVTYWNGQTDIIPVAFLLLAILLIQQHQAFKSGVALAVAMAAKFSMVLAVPFIAIYLWRNKRMRPFLQHYILGLATLVLWQGPWLFSAGFRSMVLHTPEAGRVFDLAVPIGAQLKLYLTPTLYLLAMYGVWRLRRISFELLVALTGLAFFLVVLSTPAPPGWYLWLLPFLVAHQLRSDRSAVMLTGGFSMLLITMHLFISGGASLPLLHLDPRPTIAIGAAMISPHWHSIWITVLVATGLVLIIQMMRERVSRNDYFRIAQRPVMIGIAGDSGAGKDTLSQHLVGMFGEHSVVHVSGDDYHIWDRFAPMWQGLTHLNPRANDLRRFNDDVLALIDGKTIECRHYDHQAGRFLPPHRLRKNDVLIASGLHALQLPRLRQRFDVAIYLDIDEKLRQAWKIHRDVKVRGHDQAAVLRSMARREPDAQRFIYPQKNLATLVLRLQPVNAGHLESAASPDQVRLELVALIRNGSYHERVARILIGVCGLHLDMEISEDSGEVEMTIEGDVAAEDIGLAASKLVPDLAEMLDIQPRWQDGMSGIMQLLVLIQIEESLKNRSK